MAIINTRSPNFESIDYVGMSYSTLEIWIWTGSELNLTSGTTYTLRKSATVPTSGNPTVTFETSELIRDYLDSTFNGNYSGQGVWVKHWMKVYNSSEELISSREFTKIALDGYSYFEEENVKEQSPMISNKKLFVLDDNTFRVPIYTELNPTIVFIKDNEIIANQTFYKDEESSNQIKYVSIYGDNENWDTFKERVLENGGTSYEPNNCLKAYFNSYSIGGVDEIRLSYNDNGSELILNTDLTNTNYWIASGGVVVVPAPVSLSSYLLVGVGDVSSTAISNVTQGDEFTVSGWFRGIGACIIKLQELGGDSTDYFERTITLTSDWTYFQVSGTKEADGNPAKMVISKTLGSSGNIEVYQPSVRQSYGIKTDVINVETLQECKYEPKKVTFINKFGVLQDMYFFKKSVERMNVEKESYKSNILDSNMSYSRSNHVYRDFNVSAKESVTLSSGFLSEEYNEVFKQMMLSEKVWVTNITEDGEQVLPINVKTSDITYKTSLNDKLVQYTIEFDKSFDTINNIR